MYSTMQVITWKRYWLSGLAGILLLAGCSKDLSNENDAGKADGALSLEISPVVRNEALEAGQSYINDFGESYSVTNFEFYLHAIRLVKDNGTVLDISDTAHYLVNMAVKNSETISLKVPGGTYTAIRFEIGIDSALNFSGAQTGVLDPLNGMFWSWNSGYVYAKLEGESIFSTGPTPAFSYHIGGYKAPYNAARTISLTIPVATPLVVSSLQSRVIEIDADINTWFGHVTDLKIADNPGVHSPGALAMQYADNYAGMFAIKGVR